VITPLFGPLAPTSSVTITITPQTTAPPWPPTIVSTTLVHATGVRHQITAHGVIDWEGETTFATAMEYLKTFQISTEALDEQQHSFTAVYFFGTDGQKTAVGLVSGEGIGVESSKGILIWHDLLKQ
jgi:hypothetical protein